MGDVHVCSMCGVAQAGKPHLRLAWENWPVEEIYTYRGRERPRTVNKEIITIIGLECRDDPERWADFPPEDEGVAAFFEALRVLGKNPTFLGELAPKQTLVCRAVTCAQRQPVEGQDPLSCSHIMRSEHPGTSLDQLYCWAGHPGVILVRGDRGTKARLGKYRIFAGSLAHFWRSSSWRTRLAYLVTWGPPALFVGVWWCVMMAVYSPYYLKKKVRPV